MFIGFCQLITFQGDLFLFFAAIAQNGKKLRSGLLLCKYPTAEISLLVPVDQYMLWVGDQTVLQPPKSPDGLLIGPGIEKPDIQGLVLSELGQIYGVHMLLRIVIIIAVTGQATQEHPFVFLVPPVDRQGDEPFADGP